MAIIRRPLARGGHTYQVKVRDPDGRWFKTPTFESLPDAEREEFRLKELGRKGKRTLSLDAKRYSVDDYWEVWSVEGRPKVSAGWRISQDQMFRDYVSPTIGKLKIGDVRKPQIGRVLQRAEALGRGEQTQKHIYSLLRKMFADAVEYWEMLPESPVSAKFHRPDVPTRERRFLEPAQAFHLLESTRNDLYGPPIWLQTLAALRVSEVQAGRWEAVEAARRQMLIKAAFNKKTGKLQDYPKQEDWARVPLVPMLLEYLEGRRGHPLEFVAPGIKGGMLPYDSYEDALKRLCLRAGLPPMSTHELRHSCTEIWVQAGAGGEDIRRLLNHASLSATARYMHRTDERLSSLAENVGPQLRVIPGGQMFPKLFPNGNKETCGDTAQHALEQG